MPNMSQEKAEGYAKAITALTQRSRNMIRDLNPSDNLKNIRIRNKTKEIIVGQTSSFIVIVIQQWIPYTPN